jgi:hypothetical protein
MINLDFSRNEQSLSVKSYDFVETHPKKKAINTAISITTNTIQPKRVILSDSLSCLTALDGMMKIDNPRW